MNGLATTPATIPVPPAVAELQLPPGFRFHPTDEELMVHYLSKKANNAFGGPIPIIAEVDLYKYDPWDLPQHALFGEREWYFFSPRERKYPNGARPNRAAASGYWKATGTDKPISSSTDGRKVGVKKALVFYKGRAPRGIKTNWIMHEYRLIENPHKPRRKGSRLDDWVLCRIYKKKTKLHRAPSKAETKRAAAALSAQPVPSDDVLASLPEIDSSRISSLPRLGSLNDTVLQGLLTNYNSNASSVNAYDQAMAGKVNNGVINTVTRDEPSLNMLQQYVASNGLSDSSFLFNTAPGPQTRAHNFFSAKQEAPQQQFGTPQYNPSGFLDYSNSCHFFST